MLMLERPRKRERCDKEEMLVFIRFLRGSLFVFPVCLEVCACVRVCACVCLTYDSGLKSEWGHSSSHNDPLENERSWEAGWTYPEHEVRVYVCVERWE